MFKCSKIKEDFKGLVSQLNQDRNFASRSRCSGASLTNFFSCFPRTSPQIRGMICKFLDKSALFKASEQNSLLRKARALLLGRQTGLLINELPAQAAKQVSGDRQNGLKCSTKNPLFQRSFPNEHNRRVAETLRASTALRALPHRTFSCTAHRRTSSHIQVVETRTYRLWRKTINVVHGRTHRLEETTAAAENPTSVVYMCRRCYNSQVFRSRSFTWL